MMLEAMAKAIDPEAFELDAFQRPLVRDDGLRQRAALGTARAARKAALEALLEPDAETLQVALDAGREAAAQNYSAIGLTRVEFTAAIRHLIERSD